MRLRTLIVAATMLTGLAAAPAMANPVSWVTWNGAGVVQDPVAGAASGSAGSVGISYTGQLDNLFLSYPSYTPAATWVGGIVGNTPNPNQIIQLTGGTGSTNTITFSKPVTDPVLAIWSLGQGGTTASFNFDATPTFDAGGPSAEYGGSPITVSGNDVFGVEGNGSIHFSGTFSSISFTNPVYENWYGFTVGIAGGAVGVPEPLSAAVFGAGLAALGLARRRRA